MRFFLNSLARCGRLVIVSKKGAVSAHGGGVRMISTSFVAAKHPLKEAERHKFPALPQTDTLVLQPYVAELVQMEESYREQLDRRLSMRTDLRIFEDFFVNCPDGKHKLANLGQISKKGQLIVVNFAQNPSVIQHAKTDLQKVMPDINVQQEGASLYIKTALVTRERRKEIAAKVRASLFKDYKTALNKIYDKFNKKLEVNVKSKDEFQRHLKYILQAKKDMEARAETLLNEREDELMKEVVQSSS